MKNRTGLQRDRPCAYPQAEAPVRPQPHHPANEQIHRRQQGKRLITAQIPLPRAAHEQQQRQQGDGGADGLAQRAALHGGTHPRQGGNQGDKRGDHQNMSDGFTPLHGFSPEGYV